MVDREAAGDTQPCDQAVPGFSGVPKPWVQQHVELDGVEQLGLDVC